ncbi:MAG: tetratricopeptide repeat protein [Ignavibacteriales bacterium]|nr:tetratricopeptide repeat protein [Ignavibacteriales bacterium]
MIQKIYLSILFVFLSLCTFAQEVPQKYNEAMDAFNRNDYVLASKLFDEFGKLYSIKDEFSATAYYYLAECLLKLEKVDASISSFEFFINKFTWSNFRNKALYKLGNLYFQQNNYSLCRQRLETLIKEYPESEFIGSSYYFIGESYSAENNNQGAIQFLEDAISSKKENKYVDYSIYSLANVYEKIADFKKAVAYYDTLLAYYKTSRLAPDAQVRIGVCYFKLKEYDNAVIELTDPLISELPAKQLTEAKFILAHSFYRLKEYPDAEKTFLEVINKNPASSIIRQVRYGLAWSYFQQQKYEEAYKVFNLLGKGGKDTIAINSFFWSAESKRYEGKEAEANLIYDEFLEKYPNSPLVPKVQLQMGITNFDKKKQISEDKLLEALNSSDNSVRAKALTLLGELKLNQNQFNKAKDNFEEALTLEELPSELRNRTLLGLGVSLYYLNQYSEAITQLNLLKSKSPQFETDKVNFYLAESYFSNKDFSATIKYYNQIDNNAKELAPQVIFGKGYSYFNLKDYNNAAYNFSDFVRRYKEDKNFADARLRLADSYYGQKKFSEAGKVYKEIFRTVNSKLNNDYAYYQYAQSLFKSGNSSEAIQEFTRLQEKFPDSKYVAECQYVVGWIYFQKGKFFDAINNYNVLIERYPKSPLIPVAYNSIANSYFNLGKYDSAKTFYDKVLSDFPNTNFSFDALNGIKDSYIADGKPDQAITLIDSYIAENSKVSFADQLVIKKGEIYYSLRNYEKAKLAYKDFINFYPNSSLVPDAYYWIGKSASNLKQNEEALLNFNKVISSSLNSEMGVSAVLETGKIYFDLKNYDTAIEIYERAINKLPPESPKIAEIAYNKAMALVAKGDVNKAYEEFNYLIQYHEGTIFAANAKYEIALIELARKNYETSDLLLRELSENRNDDLGAKAQFYYGQSLFEQNKIDEAITALVRVRFAFSAYDEWLTKSYLLLGECYEKKNDFQKAKELYRTVQSRHQGDEFGRQAQKKLGVLK